MAKEERLRMVIVEQSSALGREVGFRDPVAQRCTMFPALSTVYRTRHMAS